MALPTAASVITSGVAAYPTVYYDRVAGKTLEHNLFMYQACDQKPMPNSNGVAMQIFNRTAMVANTTPATEGTPGSGQTMTETTGTINLSQYVDYITFSDKVVLTHIVDEVAAGAELLGYRGALSVDTVISTAVDTAAAADVNARIDLAHGTNFTAAAARQAVYTLDSNDILPKSNGLYFGIVHSLMVFNLVNDASAGGFTDLQKYSDATAASNPALSGIKQQRVGNVGGVEFYKSNALTFDANWQGFGQNAYHAYVFGQEAFYASSLGKTQLGRKNFSIKSTKFTEPIALDPANVIGAAVSYNFFFGLVKRPGAVSAFRRIRAESSIG